MITLVPPGEHSRAMIAIIAREHNLPISRSDDEHVMESQLTRLAA